MSALLLALICGLSFLILYGILNSEKKSNEEKLRRLKEEWARVSSSETPEYLPSEEDYSEERNESEGYSSSPVMDEEDNEED